MITTLLTVFLNGMNPKGIINMSKLDYFKSLRGLPLKLRIKLSLIYDQYFLDSPVYENLWDYYKRKGLSDKEVEIYYNYVTKDIQNFIL